MCGFFKPIKSSEQALENSLAYASWISKEDERRFGDPPAGPNDIRERATTAIDFYAPEKFRDEAKVMLRGRRDDQLDSPLNFVEIWGDGGKY